MKLRGFAIPWYRKEDWPRWHAICPNFAPDYDKWLQKAEAGFKEEEARGYFPKKIVIEPDKFVEWSRLDEEKIPSDARRAAYAMSILTARERAETRQAAEEGRRREQAKNKSIWNRLLAMFRARDSRSLIERRIEPTLIGASALEEEALALLRRARPFAPPPRVPGERGSDRADPLQSEVKFAG